MCWYLIRFHAIIIFVLMLLDFLLWILNFWKEWCLISASGWNRDKVKWKLLLLKNIYVWSLNLLILLAIRYKNSECYKFKSCDKVHLGIKNLMRCWYYASQFSILPLLFLFPLRNWYTRYWTFLCLEDLILLPS